MAQLAKLLIIAVAGLVTLLVVIVILVAWLFDPNDYKAQIAEAVEEETGRSFVIEGDLELKLFPWLRVTSGAMELGNAPGFSAAPFARIEAVSASLRLMPLFSRRVEIGTVRLGGLALNLEVDAQGRNNWVDLADDDATTDPAPAPGEREFDLADLSIGGVEIRDANVRYSDAQADQVYALESFNLELDALVLGQPTGLRFDFGLRQQRPEITGEVSGRGVLTLDLDADRLGMTGLRVDLDLRGAPDAPLARFSGAVRASSLSAELTAQRYTLDELNMEFTAVGEPVPATRQQASLSAASLSADMTAGTLAQRGLRADALGLALLGEFEGSGLNETLRLQGRFEVPQFSPRDTLRLLEIDYDPADATALTRASLQGMLDLQGDDLRLSDLVVRLDDSALSGRVGIVAERITFDVEVDAINVDRYLLPSSDAAASEGEGDIDEMEIPTDLLRELNAEGQFRIGRATLGGLEFRNLVLGVNATDGMMRLNPLRSEFFGGSYEGDIRIDARPAEPRLTLNERVSGVQLGELTQAMFEVEQVTGLIQGAFNLSADGRTLGDMRRKLNGDIVFGLTDGAWEGVDVWYQVRSARAALRQESRPAAPERPRTEFSEVTGTATVTDVVLDNRDLVALLPFMRLAGQGRINLIEATLDYRLDATFVDRPELARDATMADLRGRRLPLRIDGALSEPRIRPDFGAMVTDEVRDQVRSRAEDLLRDRLGLGREAPAPEGEPQTLQEGEEAAEEAPRESSEERLRRRLGRILGGDGS